LHTSLNASDGDVDERETNGLLKLATCFAFALGAKVPASFDPCACQLAWDFVASEGDVREAAFLLDGIGGHGLKYFIWRGGT
jgi:hypothetical protein